MLVFFSLLTKLLCFEVFIVNGLLAVSKQCVLRVFCCDVVIFVVVCDDRCNRTTRVRMYSRDWLIVTLMVFVVSVVMKSVGCTHFYKKDKNIPA